MRRDASCEETLRERNRFVCIFIFEKKREPPLMLLYGEFGTVA